MIGNLLQPELVELIAKRDFSQLRSILCDFSPADRSFARALAQQCAQALERARLYESELNARRAAERSAHRSEWLTEASHLLVSSLDYHATLKQLAALAVPELALARRTEWREPRPGFFTGQGQRLLTTEAGDLALLDLREITFADGEPA